jgi:hypothetical protein
MAHRADRLPITVAGSWLGKSYQALVRAQAARRQAAAEPAPEVRR